MVKEHTHTHTHTHTILFSHNKGWNVAICNNMDALGDTMLSEISHKEKYCMISLTCEI